MPKSRDIQNIRIKKYQYHRLGVRGQHLERLFSPSSSYSETWRRVESVSL